MQLDSVQIGAADVEGAAAAYALFLGASPSVLDNGAKRFQLGRGAVEIEGGAPGVHSIRFTPAAGDDLSMWRDGDEHYHGLHVRVEPTARAPAPFTPQPGAPEAIDHVVVQSPDLDRAIALWRDRLGVRLAFDREFPARGLRLVFFRSGGITLEFVGAFPPPSGPAGDDHFYGVSYRIPDLAACRERLVRAGLDVSDIRAGHKAGTHVATLRSGTASVPTLLLQASRTEPPHQV